MFSLLTRFLFLVGLLSYLMSCTQSNNSGGDTTPSNAPEPSLCTTNATPTDPVTITGSAKFQRRISSDSGLGAVDSTSYPIRYAEVEVVATSSGTRIQCGTTDENGAFSIQVSRQNSSVTLSVNSRASNSNVAVSVLDTPSTSNYYSISSSFTPTSDQNIGELLASATGDLKGGAFNIYDQILEANDFLRTKVTTDTCSPFASEGCTAFTVAPKVLVYWAKGVNPAKYFGAPDSPLSFYIPEDDTLYILGGLNGDTDSSDTDHFDNSIIIHEYGHFIEDQYSKTDSPGGSHDGNSVIDPRLAWGEGWANFFQAAVSNDPVYRDTYGNSDGTTGVYFNLDVEEMCGVSGHCDRPTQDGEGNFREFSITRLFWDFIDPANETGKDDVDSASFAELWTVLSQKFSNSQYHYRNVGLFNSLRAAMTNATNISTLLTSEKQRGDQSDYARTISAQGSCSFTIQETNSSYLNLTDITKSHQLTTNDFYQISHSGGTFNLTLDYLPVSSGVDLDLYLYKEGYTYGTSSDLAASANSSNDSGQETLSLNLSAGVYMINVIVYKGTAAQTYQLKNGAGALLCP